MDAKAEWKREHRLQRIRTRETARALRDCIRSGVGCVKVLPDGEVVRVDPADTHFLPKTSEHVTRTPWDVWSSSEYGE